MGEEHGSPRRVVLVDDERPARDDLKHIMRPWPDVEVVGEAATIEAATEVIERERPDIVLLDIQLHKRSGFELLGALEAEVSVVFVTAFFEHAVRAFEVSAVDYLLKPVEPGRLRRALDRVGERRPRLSRPSPRLSRDEVLLLKSGRRYHFVPVHQIRYVQAQGEYTEVHAVSATGLTARSMNEWEAMLPEDRFVRIHRATIVNLHFVTTMAPADGASYRLTLRNSTQTLSVSRRYAAKLRDRLP